MDTERSLREVIGTLAGSLLVKQRQTIDETLTLLEQCDCTRPACLAARLRLARG